jgi:hypothetical protein
VLAEGLTNSVVDLQGQQMGYGGQASVAVIGSGKGGNSRVAIFGCTSGAEMAGDFPVYDVRNGGNLIVEDAWYEGPVSRIARLADTGTFTYHSGNIAPQNGAPVTPVIEVASFAGRITLLALVLDLDDPARAIQVSSEIPETNLLLLGLIGNQPSYILRKSSAGYMSSVNNKLSTKAGTVQTPDSGEAPSPEFTRSMLNQSRTIKPLPLTDLSNGITDVRLFRVGIDNPIVGLYIKH